MSFKNKKNAHINVRQFREDVLKDTMLCNLVDSYRELKELRDATDTDIVISNSIVEKRNNLYKTRIEILNDRVNFISHLLLL